MKVIWRGRLSDRDKLSEEEIPRDAVPFLEDQEPIEPYAAIIPILAYAAVCWSVKSHIAHGITMNTPGKIWGVMLIAPLLIVHELLHLVWYPTGATAEIILTKAGIAMTSTKPFSRRRYVLMALTPCIILGLLPLAAWVFVPKHCVTFGTAVFVGALASLAGCTADIASALRAMSEMPRGSSLQTSGLKAYWFTR